MMSVRSISCHVAGLFSAWATLSEQKWVTSRERRSDGGHGPRNRELDPAEEDSSLDPLALLSEAIRPGRRAEPTDETAGLLSPVADFRRSVAAAKLEPLKPKLGALGRLDVLGVKQNDAFTSRLADLALKDLTQEELVRLSRLLHRYFAAQRFAHRPLGVEESEPAIETPYDYVLVDSRTGITEIGGLCVGPLADRLVVITGRLGSRPGCGLLPMHPGTRAISWSPTVRASDPSRLSWLQAPLPSVRSSLAGPG